MALPKPLLLGPEIGRPSSTANLTPSLPVAQAAHPPIYVRRYARNGRLPDAWCESAMGEAMNQASMSRGKTVFTAINKTALSTLIGLQPPAASTARWRWAFHTGPHTHLLHVIAVMFAAKTGVGDASSTVQVQKMAGGGTVSDTLHVGANPINANYANGWQYMRVFHTYLPVDPDTDYEGLITDGANAMMQSACVFEVTSLTNAIGGYFPQNVPERAPILSTDRSRMMTTIRDLWRRGGAHVLNWYCLQSGATPLSVLSATATNIIDNTSTTIGSATPGYTLDMRYKDRISQTSGVPCVMYAYGQLTGSATVGSVFLKNSAGTTIATVTGFTTTAGWHSVSFNLPATLDKYDVQASMTGGGGAKTLALHAVSIFEYEA